MGVLNSMSAIHNISLFKTTLTSREYTCSYNQMPLAEVEFSESDYRRGKLPPVPNRNLRLFYNKNPVFK